MAPSSSGGEADPVLALKSNLNGFRPYGMEALTRFAHGGDWPALSSLPGKEDVPRMGKVTQPSGAPANHLL